MSRIGILGAGTFGVSLARMLCLSGHTVTVWSALADEIVSLAATRRHPNLGEMVIPDAVVFTADIATVCHAQDLLLVAVPSPYVRATARAMAPYIPDGQIVVDVAKGFEADTLYTMSRVIREELCADGAHDAVRVVALSGPTHAEEIARDLPTTIVSACIEAQAAQRVQEIFSNTCMRVYTNPDVLGVELCGALKNVIALAAGVSAGLGYGDNACAALITRGMAEITRLGVAMGCAPDTFYGLAGIGDLIVTATSVHSRNNRCGRLIGEGMTPAEAVAAVGMVVEGINALPAAIRLGERYGVELPLIRAVHAVVVEGASPADTVRRLMGRDRKTETTDLQYERALLLNKRGDQMKRVITYGTFDLLHYGHINLLRRAKAQGDYLIVALSTDEFNRDEKHKHSYFSYDQRKALLEAIRYVDLVIPEHCWEQKRDDIRTYRIDTVVMGDDWEGQFDFLREEGAEVVYLPRTPEVSSSRIKEDLQQ